VVFNLGWVDKLIDVLIGGSMQSVLITGVSTGIGRVTAEWLLKRGYRVFGSVRKIADSQELTETFPDTFHSLTFDVTDEQKIHEAVETVKNILGSKNLDCLINNAGIAVGGPTMLLHADEFRRQFEVNLFGVINVTNAFLPLLGAEKNAHHKGRIINVSSISGRRSAPFIAPYTSSKFALEAYSDSLRCELQLYGVDVILIEPGPIQSEIWNKVPDADDNPFVGSDFEPMLRRFYNYFKERGEQSLPTEVIARKFQSIMESQSPKTRYVLTQQKFKNFTLPRFLPDRWVDRIIGKRLKLTG